MSEGQTEPVIITGVVHPSGSAGAQTKGETEWVLTFKLETWRDENGNLQRDELQLFRPVSRVQRCGRIWRVFNPISCISIAGQVYSSRAALTVD